MIVHGRTRYLCCCYYCFLYQRRVSCPYSHLSSPVFSCPTQHCTDWHAQMLLLNLAVGGFIFEMIMISSVDCSSISSELQCTQGDIIIGGLYSIHHGNCQDANVDVVNVLLSEAHLLSLDYVNKNVLDDINIRFGTRMWDTCNSAGTTLQRCVNLISPVQQDKGICEVRGHRYNFNNISLDDDENCQLNDGVLAVTGAFNSDVAKNINYLMQAFCIPVIGTLSTSAELDDASRYPYFVRTSASDKYIARVVYDIVLARGWLHLNVIYDTSSSGLAMMLEFRSLIDVCMTADADLRLFRPPCVEKYYDLDVDGPNRVDQLKTDWQALRFGLAQKSGRVLLLFMQPDTVLMLLDKLKSFGYEADAFQLIIAGGTAIATDDASRHTSLLNNSISIDEHMVKWDLLERRLIAATYGLVDNKWLLKLIAIQNECCVFELPDIWGGVTKCDYVLCNGHEKLRYIPPVALEQSRLIFEAISMLAHAIRSLYPLFCAKGTGYCAQMRLKITGQEIYNQLLQSTFGNESHRFQLLNRSGEPYFNIYQYQSDKWSLITYRYNPLIGPTRAHQLEQPVVEPHLWSTLANESDQCQLKCSRSYADMRDSCCWRCTPCTNELMYVNESLQQCVTCPLHTIPEPINLTSCVPEPSPPLFAQLDSTLAVIIAAAIVGAVLTIGTGAIIWTMRRTPMVRASTPDLCVAQVICITIMFVTTGLMTPTSSSVLCAAVWSLSTILLACCHAITLAKALRMVRPGLYARLLDHLSQTQSSLLVIAIVMLGQLAIVGLWLLLRAPVIYERTRTGDGGDAHRPARWCSANDELQTVILFVMPIVILLISAVYQRAGLRNPYMFQVRQSRIGLAGSMCYLVNYAVLLPLTFLQNDQLLDIKSSVMMCLSMITGFVSWTTMLFPVLYVCATKRKQNKHEYVKRERSRQFTDGNMMYFIDAVILQRARTSIPTDSDVDRGIVKITPTDPDSL